MDQRELWHYQQPYVAIRLKKGEDIESYIRPIRDNQVQIQNVQKTTLRFERVYEEVEQTESIFMESLLPILSRSIMGLNSLIFCHGQSGAGKTYTMLGKGEEKGLVYFTAEFLFEQIKQSKDAIQINIHCYEIYQETIFDLMKKEEEEEEEKKKIPNNRQQVQKYQILSIDDVQQIITDYAQKRIHSRETINNQKSSRGHIIFEFELIKVQNKKLITKISLVDLAWSIDIEDDKDRQRENIMINKSLFALNNVIRQLRLNHKYINYNDSKLTYCLKHLLKKDTLLAFILLIKQDYSDKHFSETTLKFGQNVRQIQSAITREEQQGTKSEDYLIRENEQLKQQIIGLQMQLQLKGPLYQTDDSISLRQLQKIREKEQQQSRMEKDLQDANNMIQNLMNSNKVYEAKIKLLEGETKLGQQLQFSRQISHIEQKLLQEFKHYYQNNEREQQEEIEEVKNAYVQQNYQQMVLNEQFWWNFEIDAKEQFE